MVNMVVGSPHVPGSSSAESNEWRNMMRCHVVKKVTADHDITHDSRSTEINMTTNMIPPVVAKKDTASQNIECGTIYSRFNALTNLMPPSIVNKKTATPNVEYDDTVHIETQKRGFQHVFKSTSTSSSRRVKEAYRVSEVNGTPLSKHARRRDKVKRKKIESLLKIASSSVHAHGRTFLSTRPVFYSGTAQRHLPSASSSNGIVLSALKDLKVIDTIFGARLESETGDIVFILIPRQDAISQMTHVKKTIASLYALEKGKRTPELRGKTRITVAEDNGKYATVGLKPNRGCTGVSEIWPKMLSTIDRDAIRKLMRRCEETAKRYLPSNALRGLRMAQLLGDWMEISGVTTNPIWGSLACGKNYFLNSHVDEDFFYSLTTVASECGLHKQIDRYMIDAEVCNFFTFPEQGIAVALRPGDMLIFNPQYHHCLSSRTSNFDTDDVFCLSLYLKTAVVGKNDNSML